MRCLWSSRGSCCLRIAAILVPSTSDRFRLRRGIRVGEISTESSAPRRARLSFTLALSLLSDPIAWTSSVDLLAATFANTFFSIVRVLNLSLCALPVKN